MTLRPLVLGAALGLLAPSLVSQQAIPEIPAKWRDVAGVQNFVIPPEPYFTRPHYPGIRTTRDGRVGVMVEGGVPRFALLKPEKMQGVPFLENEASSFTMSNLEWKHLDGRPCKRACARTSTPHKARSR